MNILDILISRTHVSGEEMARELSVSRAAVHKRIQKLRGLGYNITGEKKRGYSLVGRPDILVPREIENRLKHATPASHEVLYYPVVSSTQTVAKELAARGTGEGAIVITEEQTGSYGRMQRQWISPKGGVWFTLILRPELPPEKVPQITLVVSLAVCRALEKYYPVQPVIKWPNDILIGGKKLAGILTEISAEVGKLHWVAAGIGINVNNDPPALPGGQAVSLKALSGAVVERANLLCEIVTEFDRLYAGFLTGGFQHLEAEYNRRSTLPGSIVKVSTGAAVRTGRVSRIDGDGYLWLEDADGTAERIMAGDVTVLSGGAALPKE